MCLGLAGVGQAIGNVPRAFVSINGSDTNPCSAVQPCRSFNQALTVVQPGGEIVVQNSGGYSTGFTITQGVTIDATGVNASAISTSATDLCTINTGPGDRVVLRGISFHGASVGGNAIAVAQVGSLYVEHCSIAEFTGDGVHMPFGGSLWVTDTDVRKCQSALLVESNGAVASNLVAQDSRFAECVDGIRLGTASTGLSIGSATNCTASACTNGFIAFSQGSNGAVLTLSNCRAIGGSTGLAAMGSGSPGGGALIFILNCVVMDNNVGIFTSGGTPLSGGPGAVFGTNPGTNLIANNPTGGTTSTSATLQ